MDFENFNTSEDTVSMRSQDDYPANYHSILLDLKKMDKTDLHEFMRKVLDVVASALNIERVSIWFYNEDKTEIYCDYLYLKKFGEYATESTLLVKDYPLYFNAIDSNLYVAVDDALTDTVTSELVEDYLKPRGIHSLMDIPIHYRGETIGIICHEEQDKVRHWKREEMDFTSAISSLVSTSLEIDYRKSKERDFHESQRFLSTLISNLPGYVYRVNKEGATWSIQYISDGVLDLSGYSPKELIKNKVLYYAMMVNEDDKARAKEIITKALATHKPYQINYRICTAEGKLKWVWEQGRGVYSDKGDLVATEGFVTDITEKKLFEEEILKKNNELSALYHFGKSLSKLAEPAMIIDDIGTMLGKLFNSPNIYLALFNEAEQSISYPFYLKEGKRIDHGSRPFANAFTEFVIKSRKGVFLNENVKASLTFLGITGSSIEAKSLIAAPMTAGEKVLGVITIQDFNNENSFTQSQLELLTTVGSQAAIALENSYLYLEVTKQLREKEVLLQEVHHRVKNNLQVMSSLIKLQARYIKDDRMLDVMKETGGRIQSMAIVHTKLYNSGDYEFINFGEYVKSLTENFQSAYGYKLRNVRFNIDIDNIIINIDTAIPCGLIINELISNSIKYAFPEDKEGEIGISLARTGEGKLHLKVKDNGEGVDDGIDLGKAETLGIQLVTLLTRQMNGTMEVVSTRSNGTEFNIIFEEAVYKARK